MNTYNKSYSHTGFCGSRSLSGPAAALCRSVSASLSASGSVVSVGCASGADAAVRSAVPSAVVFSVASGLWGSGRAAYARRSAALVRSLPPGSAFVGFPAAPCPSGVVPARSWRSGRPVSGSWSALALASGLGLSVFVFGVPAPSLPAWPGSWSPVSAGPLGGSFSFSVPCQLSLF